MLLLDKPQAKRGKISTSQAQKALKRWMEHVEQTLVAVVDAHQRTKSKAINFEEQISVVASCPQTANLSSDDDPVGGADFFCAMGQH